MIQPLISLIIIFPLIIGILSVDITGEPQSIRQFLKSDTVGNVTSLVESALPSNPPEIPPKQDDIEKEPFEPIYLVDIDLTESGKALDSFNTSVAQGITFLLFQVKDFGVWLGMSTAPFHYLLALLIGFSFLFPDIWMFIVGFFYIVIKEHKEIRMEFHNARVRAKMK